jgi:hypothetical protein
VSDNTPHEPAAPSGESFRARRAASGPLETPPDDTRTGIIRRAPTGPIPVPLADDTRTGIIRRAPSGPIPRLADDAPTSFVRGQSEPAWGHHPLAGDGVIRSAPRRIGSAPAKTPSAATAIAATAANILNGWATAVIATDLISGWWRTDRLFCVGVGFLTAVCAATIITGAVQVLLRRRVGIYLTVVGAAIAVLIFAGIFVTGAHVAGVVRAMPVLPATAALFALLPPTWRWTRKG